MSEFMSREELKAIHEHAECDFPFDEAEDDVRKLLRYVDFLENMPIVQTLRKLQEENERMFELLHESETNEAFAKMETERVQKQNELLCEALQKIVDSEYQDAGGYGKFHASVARQALEGANS